MKTTTSFIILALTLLSSKVLGNDGCKSLEELACSTTEHGAFSIFCQMMFTDFPSMGLDLKLDGGIWTVFMPTDEAFEAYNEVLEPVFEQHSNMFWETDFAGLNIISYHFVNGAAMTARDLPCSDLITMSNGETSRHKCEGGIKFQKGQGNHQDGAGGLPFPKIIETDIEFCNGMVHVLDGIMLPNNFENAPAIAMDDDFFDEATTTGVVSNDSSGDDDEDDDGDDSMGGMEIGVNASNECAEPESVFAVVNKFQIRQDNNCVEDWIEATKNNAHGARTTEPGALRFDVINLGEDEYILYELYHDEVAFLEGHLFTPHFQDWFAVRQRCVIQETPIINKLYVDNTYDVGSFFSPFCAN